MDATCAQRYPHMRRTAQNPLNGRGLLASVVEDDPPRVGTGHRLVRMDHHGHVVRLEIGPVTAERPVAPATVAMDEALIGRIFTLAGLDRDAFVPTETRALSRVEADAMAAWTGPYPGIEGEEVRATAGFRDGAMCWFRVEYPFEIGADGPARPTPPEWVEWVGTGLVWVLIVGGGVIAWKNIRARRSDVRAGVRAAMVIFVAWSIGALLMRDHVPGMSQVFFGESPIIVSGLMNAAYFLLFYIALEPTARRVWPSLLVSWIRLTSGRWKDPMVGRDVLVGMAVGAVIVLVTRIGVSAPVWFGVAPGVPVWTTPASMLGLHHVAGYTLWGLSIGIINASVITLMLVMLRVVLRVRVVAVIVMMILWAGLAGSSELTTHWSVALAVAAVQVLQITLLLRLGFLAMAASAGVVFLVGLVPAGFGCQPWWAGTAVIPAIALGSLTIFGYLTATADRAQGGTVRRASA